MMMMEEEEEEEEEGNEDGNAAENEAELKRSGDHFVMMPAEEEEEQKCRFCGNPLAPEQMFIGVCKYDECRRKQADACPNTLPCGHWCSGIAGEPKCPSCLQCASAVENSQDADDLCMICYSERLGESPCVLLKCRHIFHWHCLRTCLEKRWPGPRISFRFMQCPLCNAAIEHQALEELLVPLRELREEVAEKARMRMEYEGVGSSSSQQLVGQSAAEPPNQNALLELALAKYMYVQCSRCKKAYYGGDAQCQQELEQAGLAQQVFDPAELVCGSCAAMKMGGGATAAGACGRHGTEFLEFKCRFCCSVAMYFCFGSTHFCAACHSDFQRIMAIPKHALPKCPVGPRAQQLPDTEPCPLRIVAHPPTGEEFALGCGICRNLHTF